MARRRPRPRCGDGALGEKLGVALVEPDDGVAEVVDPKEISADVSPERVDLE